jgi:hypothetical protein
MALELALFEAAVPVLVPLLELLVTGLRVNGGYPAGKREEKERKPDLTNTH